MKFVSKIQCIHNTSVGPWPELLKFIDLYKQQNNSYVANSALAFKLSPLYYAVIKTGFFIFYSLLVWSGLVHTLWSHQVASYLMSDAVLLVERCTGLGCASGVSSKPGSSSLTRWCALGLYSPMLARLKRVCNSQKMGYVMLMLCKSCLIMLE